MKEKLGDLRSQVTLLGHGGRSGPNHRGYEMLKGLRNALYGVHEASPGSRGLSGRRSGLVGLDLPHDDADDSSEHG